jgi:hypothetical protein
MNRYLAAALTFLVACGPVEEADPILHVGDSCTMSNVMACSGQGQAAVTCVDRKYASVLSACQSPCRAPGDYCDIGFQPVGSRCIGVNTVACGDSMHSVFCLNGVNKEFLDCTQEGGCETVNGISGCKRVR